MNMTMNIGLATSGGVVAIVDGRAVDPDDTDHPSDTEVKIFELSTICAVMISGHTFDGFSEYMTVAAEFYAQFGWVNVSRIAQSLSEMFKDNQENGNFWWLNDADRNVTLTVVGYDISYDGFIPKIVYIQKPAWDLFSPIPNPMIGQSGSNYQQIKEYLLGKYRQNATILSADKLAVKAMKKAIELEPTYVGGNIKLWNIVPGQRIEKLECDSIADIERILTDRNS